MKTPSKILQKQATQSPATRMRGSFDNTFWYKKDPRWVKLQKLDSELDKVIAKDNKY